MRKVLLVILDGWGHSDFQGEPDPSNAIEFAHVPTFRRLYAEWPRTRLACSGLDVGLPRGQMGNSEVGHLNLGAGRIVNQDIVRIDRSMADDSFGERLGLSDLAERLRESGGRLHVAGLVSDGGVHSHLRHFEGLLDRWPTDVPLRLHCFTDGRDTSPMGGLEYVGRLAELCDGHEAWAIASVTGRYWAMDRDNRWDRTKKAFDLMARGEATEWADDVGFLARSYDAGTTDEFVEPTGIRGAGEEGMGAEDVVLLMNFRADRMRQITAALCHPDFDGFERPETLPLQVISMTEYEDHLPTTVVFAPVDVKMGLSEFLAAEGRTQLKVAETEKYAHVTYFFNGGEETPWVGEDRALVPSPKVATYDLQPEMSARGVADAVIEGLRGDYDFILVNFANPDMVGHTGVIPAATAAVEAVDACMADILECVEAHPEWVALVTADHGNCEKMLNEDGSVHTAHTTEPVDFIVFDPRDVTDGGGPARPGDGGGSARARVAEVEAAEASGPKLLADARLADVAPTVLAFLGLEPPVVMDGRDILGRGSDATGRDASRNGA